MTPTQWCRWAVERYNNIDDHDVAFLAAHVIGCKRAYLPFAEFCHDNVSKLNHMLMRLVGGEPLAYIIGETEFMGMTFLVNPHVLIPRSDTEWWVSALLENWQGPAPERILDLGTGSGVILASCLRRFSDASGLGVDCHDGAIGLAQENLENLGLSQRGRITRSHWFSDVRGVFDLIVANPPYIAYDDMRIQPNVKTFEPSVALFSCDDGLKDLRQIVLHAQNYMNQDSKLVIEFGRGQEHDVFELAQQGGFKKTSFLLDGAGYQRAIMCEMVLA